MNGFCDDFNNPAKVSKWYIGIHAIFKHIQKINNWSKQEAWDELKLNLYMKQGV